jgi:hypothetical protein
MVTIRILTSNYTTLLNLSPGCKLLSTDGRLSKVKVPEADFEKVRFLVK